MTIDKKQLNTILEDIFAVDEKLRAYENELEKIILSILQNAPPTEFDENFRLMLREQLMAEAARLKQAQPVYAEKSPIFSIFGGKFVYAAAGILGVIILLAGAGWLAQKEGVLTLNQSKTSEPLAFKKTDLKENAFGSLFSGEGSQEPARDASGVFGRGGGGTALSPSTPQSQSFAAPEKMSLAPNAGDGVSVSGRGGTGIAMPDVYQDYKFVYKGGDFELPGDRVEVLRRKTGFDGLGGLEGMLESLGMGLIDLSSFSSLKLQNLNLTSGQDPGYSINIDFQNAAISVSESWPNFEPVVQNDTRQLKLSDIPSEEKLIEIADEFLRSHGISTQNYGQPEIEEAIFRILKGQTALDSSSMPYVSDAVQVIYPLLVGGKEVYDEGGNKSGLYVSINLRLMKASGLWNLTSQNYDASDYAAETNKQKIIEAAENGGVWGPRYFDGSANVVEVELGAPRLGYSNIWQYQKGRSSQLLVPALIFPITSQPTGIQYFNQKNIVIPLAKEFFDRNKDIPIPLPMPLETKPVSPEIRY